MDIHEFFGKMPQRPDTPDFWRLSEIVLGFDAIMDSATDKDAAWNETFAAKVDTESLMYMAMQRASRVFGVQTVGDLRKVQQEVIAMTTLYMEGFLTGVHFQEKGGKQ